MCFIGGLRLLPAVGILHRSLAVSANNAASLSNVDRNLAAVAAASNLSQSDMPAGILAWLSQHFSLYRSMIFKSRGQ